MSKEFRQQMMPKPYQKAEPYATDSAKYEGVKATINSQLVLVESCLGKCNANFNEGGLGADGDVCMTKCYNKFFDSVLVTHKEMSLYTIGMDNAI